MKRIKESKLIKHYDDLYYDISDNPEKLMGKITDTLVVMIQDKTPRTMHRIGEGVVITNDGYKAYYWQYGVKNSRHFGANEVGLIYRKAL